MNEETRLILYSLKWVIERDTFNEELRKEMDKDICNKIVDLVNPIKKESINRTPLSKIKSRLASIKEDLEDDGKLNYSNDSTKKKPGRKLKKSKR